jgi:hypothetical protein
VRHLNDSRKLLLVFVGVAVTSLIVGFVSSTIVRSPAQVAADAKAPEPTLLTAAVQTGTIRQSLVLRGTINVGKTVDVSPPLPDGVQPIVTRKSVKKGAAIVAGRSVMEIAYRPLFVLPGSIPMIRDLTQGTSGQDVAQLQEALRSVGWESYDRAGYFGTSTATALANLYRSAGYVMPTVLPNEPDAASGSGGDKAQDSSDEQPKRRPVPLGVAKQSEIAFVKGLPGRVRDFGAPVGSPITGVAVSIAISDPTITAASDPTDAQSLRKGMKVSLSSPDGSPNLGGKIKSVGEPQQDEASQAFVAQVAITSDGDLPPSAVGKDVQVSVDLAAEAKPGLVVPLSAIYSTASGATTVTKVSGKSSKVVEVQVTDSGDGLAQIVPSDGGSLQKGDLVEVGVS